MLNDPRHIIEKVSVDIDVGSMESAEKIKNEINDFVKNEVVPIIESCFSQVTPDLGDRILRLDKMELSVDTSSWNIHSNKLKQEIRSEIEKQMKPILQQVKDKNLLTEVEVSDQTKLIGDQNLQVFDKDERVLKSLFHFLENGTLPWWLNSLEESRLLFSDDSLLIAIEKNTDLVLRELTRNEGNQRFNQRLIQQFAPSITAAFIEIRLSGSVIAKRSSGAVHELQNASKEVTKKLLSLLWKLSESKSKGELFQKATSTRLFEHIHTHFYQKKRDTDALSSSLKTTFSALLFLYVVFNRETEIERLKSEFVLSLEERIQMEVFNQLTETKAYKELISGKSVSETSKSSDQTDSKSKTISDDSNSEHIDLTKPKENNTSNQIETRNLNDQESLKQSPDEPEMDDRSHTRKKVADSDEQTKKTPDSSETIKSTKQLDELAEEPVRSEIQRLDQDPKADQITDLTNDESQAASNSQEDKTQVPSIEIDQKSETSDKSDLKNKSENPNFTESSTENTSKSDWEPTKPSDSAKHITEDSQAILGNNLESKNIQKVLDDTPLDSSKQWKKTAQLMPESMFVNNAGLVLLNPFLPALFKQLDLLSESGKLTDSELAACILHYAATGREGDFEFEMTFEKYLCGIPPSEPMNREITLSELQKEEVEKVLNAVLTYWEVMKNKPIALLQNEFLTRPGKLITEKTNHRLIIERKTFDLLLDKLPWSYSMIKFSWKKELIFVEW